MNSLSTTYTSTSARFLSPYPLRIQCDCESESGEENPAFSQDFNRYSYVNNNPMRFTDPSGYNYEACGRYPRKLLVPREKQKNEFNLFKYQSIDELLIEFFYSFLALELPGLEGSMGGGNESAGIGGAGNFLWLGGGDPPNKPSKNAFSKPRYKLNLKSRDEQRFFLTKQGGYYEFNRVMNIRNRRNAGFPLSRNESDILDRVNINAFTNPMINGLVVDGLFDFDVLIPYLSKDITVNPLFPFGSFNITTSAILGNNNPFVFGFDPQTTYEIKEFDKVNIKNTGTFLGTTGTFFSTVIFNLIVTIP